MPNDMSQPPALHANLVMTPELFRSLERKQGAKSIALAFEIDSPEMATEANEELKRIKASAKEVQDWRDQFIKPAQQIVESAKALFNPALESLTQAESILKQGIQDYLTVERKRIADEQAAAEALARKQRQEAEQKAAQERAKAEEQAREARRLAQEAETARQKALADGNAKAAAAAAADAARMTEKAHAVEENAQAKVAAIEMTAAAAAPISATVTTLKGFSMRDNWVAEMAAATEKSAIEQISKAIAGGRPELISLLKLDMTAAGKLAKAYKENFNVPGLQAIKKQVAASRAG